MTDRDGTKHVFPAAQLSSPLAVTGLSGLRLTMIPKLITAALNTQLCVDQTYNSPMGVHLALWRYVQIPLSGYTCAQAWSVPSASRSIVGYAAMRPDRMRQEFGPNGALTSVIDGNGNELRYKYSAFKMTVWEPRCTQQGDPSNQNPPPSTPGPHYECRSFVFTHVPAGAVAPDGTTNVTKYRLFVQDTARRTTKYTLDGVDPATAHLQTVENADQTTITYTYGSACGGTADQVCSVTDLRTSEPGGLRHKTDFAYLSSMSPRPVATVIDRRYTASLNTTKYFTYTGPAGSFTKAEVRQDLRAGEPDARQTTVYDEIDEQGRVALAQSWDETKTPDDELRRTRYAWDFLSVGGCETLGERVNNNLCRITTKALNLTGQSNGDRYTNYVYNPEGRVVIEQREGPTDAIRTWGYKTQNALSASSVPSVQSENVQGGGTVSKAVRPWQTTPPTDTVFTVSDMVQALAPNGNAPDVAVADVGKYTTTFVVDNNEAASPNGQPSSSCDTPDQPATFTNTGNVCRLAAPAPDDDLPASQTNYRYDTYGQRTRMETPNHGIYTYAYYGDSELDLGGGTDAVSAGGWLKTITDAATPGEFVAFAYDRYGHVVRTWDRNATHGHTLGEYPGTLASAPPNFTQELYGTGTTANAMQFPWRYLKSSTDQLDETMTFDRDANGNITRTQTPRGNRAPQAEAPNYETKHVFDSGDLLTERDAPLPAGVAGPRSQYKETFTYDARGNRTAQTDRRGKMRTFEFDAANRLVDERYTRSLTDHPGAVPPVGCAAWVSSDAPLPSGAWVCRREWAVNGNGDVIQYVDGAGGSTTHRYDELGRETTQTVDRDGTGLTTLWNYDRDGNVLDVCSPRQATEGGGGCASSSQYAQHFAYSRADALVTRKTFRDGQWNATSYDYDADGNLAAETNPNGRKTDHTYDALDRRRSSKVPRTAGKDVTTSFDYDYSGNLSFITVPGTDNPGSDKDDPERISAYTYDAANRLRDTVVGLVSKGAIASATYDQGLGANVRTRLYYDADGHVVGRLGPRAFTGSTADPGSSPYVERTDFDEFGLPKASYRPRFDTVVASDPVGPTTQQAVDCPPATPQTIVGVAVPAYDTTTGVCMTRREFTPDGDVAKLYPATSTSDADRRVEYSRTDDRLLLAVNTANPDGTASRVDSLALRYDGEGHETARILADPDGTQPSRRSTTLTYTTDGLLKSVTEPDPDGPGGLSHLTTYGYDANSNRTSVTDPSTEVWSTSYYPDDLVKDTKEPAIGSQTDLQRNTTAYRYDPVGNPIEVAAPSANISAQGATADNNPRNRPVVNAFTYDNLLLSTKEPLVVTTDPATSTQRFTTYEYYDSGLKLSQDSDRLRESDGSTLENGDPQIFRHDNAGRLKIETGRKAETITNTYDADGNNLSIIDTSSGGSTVSSSFYLDGLPREVSDGGRVTRHDYDGLGMPLNVVEREGTTNLATTTYGYNDAGMPTTTSPTRFVGVGTGAFEQAYDRGGRRISVTNPSSQKVVYSWAHDDTIVDATVTKPGTPLTSHFEYTYNPRRQVLTQGTTSSTADPNTFIYSYDESGRLTGFDDDGTGLQARKDATWDADGNRLSYGRPGGLTTFSYRADDSIASITDPQNNTFAATDEPFGAVRNDGCRDYVYDGFDRLVSNAPKSGAPSACVPQGQSAKPTIAFSYDGLDRQRSRTETGVVTALHQSGLSSETLSEVKPTQEIAYTFGASGEALALTTGTSREYLIDDGQSNVGTTLSTSDTVQCTIRYEPWGDPAKLLANQDGDTNPCSQGGTASHILYRGARRDESAGTYQFGSRTYAPERGGFLTADSFRTDPGSAQLSIGMDPLARNRYSYVNGDPVNLVDPTGHFLTPMFFDIVALGNIAERVDQHERCVSTAQRMPGNGALNCDGQWIEFSGRPDIGHEYKPLEEPVIDLGWNGAIFFALLPVMLAGLVEAAPAIVEGVAVEGTAEAATVGGEEAALLLADTAPELGPIASEVGSEASILAPEVASEGSSAAADATLSTLAEAAPEIETATLNGEFSVVDWSGYPEGIERPTGPFRVLEGDEYAAARRAANEANRALHAADPTLEGLHVHEIHPVKFGGSPTDVANKVALEPAAHARFTTWWNRLLRAVG